MIAIDTNIIIRLLAQDNEMQYQSSRNLLMNNDIFIADTVILETEWVLRHAYDFDPQAICTALRKLFGLPNVRLSNAQNIAKVLDWHESGLDFADAFHLMLSQQHSVFKTFDEKLIKRGQHLSKCMLERP